MASLGAVRTGEGPLVVALHGFTQTAASLAILAEALSASHRVVRLDLPGHGDSSEVSADLDATAQLVLDETHGEPFDLIGYSLGGRVALHVALRAPSGLGRVVTIGASAGIADEAARGARLERDLSMADALESRGEVDAFLDAWLRNPMFATLSHDAADLDTRRANTAPGLADSLRRSSLGTQRWLEPELSALSHPLLAIAGARDDPFVAAGCRWAASNRAIAAAVVPGSGHACHLEQPAVVARLIGSFLDPTASRGRPDPEGQDGARD